MSLLADIDVMQFHEVRHCGGRIGLYPPVGYKLRGGRPGNGYAWRCLASASRVTRVNDDIKYVAHPASNAKSPLRLTLCAGVFRPPNRSAPESARSHLRNVLPWFPLRSLLLARAGILRATDSSGHRRENRGCQGMRPPTSWSRPFQVFKSEANSWSCRQPGPLVTHAPSVTWGNIQATPIHKFFYELVSRSRCHGEKGVSSGIPTGMPVSEHSLGSLGYPPRRDKRVPAAIIRFWRLRCFSAFHSPSAMQRKVRRRGRECRCWSVVRTVGVV
ncbi:hypothetical protein ASPFODRAFT_65287 [Aspergillus luchuensis CBS 106.47]|uniref:Uncharacterized protein n=1 Tax=Aspergillus luchuensis (strain CBS 106.47) TaxID=1137211 RepID=A0A1M3T3M0_ASPLC|nr:hypothetical protein ASPFODRAFT_65287 [Aspergillus luchuensis CBS 106.47]